MLNSIKIHFANTLWHKKADHFEEGDQSEELPKGNLIKQFHSAFKIVFKIFMMTYKTLQVSGCQGAPQTHLLPLLYPGVIIK